MKGVITAGQEGLSENSKATEGVGCWWKIGDCEVRIALAIAGSIEERLPELLRNLTSQLDFIHLAHRDNACGCSAKPAYAELRAELH